MESIDTRPNLESFYFMHAICTHADHYHTVESIKKGFFFLVGVAISKTVIIESIKLLYKESSNDS